MEPEFLELIEEDSTILEKEPLEKVAELNQLCSFKHEGFWKCMDTKRDRETSLRKCGKQVNLCGKRQWNVVF